MFLKLKQLLCRHQFKGVDLQERNAEGNISWACCKCTKNYEAECGLDIGDHGTITGPWTKTKQNEPVYWMDEVLTRCRQTSTAMNSLLVSKLLSRRSA